LPAASNERQRQSESKVRTYSQSTSEKQSAVFRKQHNWTEEVETEASTERAVWVIARYVDWPRFNNQMHQKRQQFNEALPVRRAGQPKTDKEMTGSELCRKAPLQVQHIQSVLVSFRGVAWSKTIRLKFQVHHTGKCSAKYPSTLSHFQKLFRGHRNVGTLRILRCCSVSVGEASRDTESEKGEVGEHWR